MSGLIAGGNYKSLRLLVVVYGRSGIGMQLYLLCKALLLLVVLLLAHSLGIALLGHLLLSKDGIDRHSLLLGFFLSTLFGFLLGVGFLFLCIGLLLRCTLSLGCSEALVGFLQEIGVVV